MALRNFAVRIFPLLAIVGKLMVSSAEWWDRITCTMATYMRVSAYLQKRIRYTRLKSL